MWKTHPSFKHINIHTNILTFILTFEHTNIKMNIICLENLF